MPSHRRSNLSQRSNSSRVQHAYRLRESRGQNIQRLRAQSARQASVRSLETPDPIHSRLQAHSEIYSSTRRNTRTNNFFSSVWSSMENAGFNYSVAVEYFKHPFISLGMMDSTCRFCGALRWKDESSGMCCSNGKVRLPLIDLPPEPLRSLLSGENSDSVHFLRNIRKYNSCFLMTSFGAENQTHSVTFPTTFSIQGQVYHRIGSLMPSENQPSRFLQIYFMGNDDDDDIQTDRRCQQIQVVRRNIVQGLQRMLHQHNLLVQQFKTTLENLPSDAYRVVVNADRTPPGQHPRRYNAPTANEVAVVLAGNQFGSRDIVLHQRDNSLQHVSDTHRFYDALQYPLIFWKGQEGYSFHIPQIDPNTRQPLSSKVSSMDFMAILLWFAEIVQMSLFNLASSFINSWSICMLRRRAPEAGGFTAKVRIRGREEVAIDNRWVVPYSPLLSKMFCAHINVENCSSVKAIKYICKYVNKGSDQAIINLRREGRGPDPQNEVRMYQCARYISSNEAVWRLLSFPLHQRHPAVIHLAVHLENGERIYFNQNTLAHRMRNPPRTTLTAFFSLCQTDSFARTLLYPDVPQYYTRNSSAHEWRKRVQGRLVEGLPGVKRSDTIGRVYAVHVSNFECFCLRMLLHNIKGPTSFAYLKIVNGSQYETFRETCAALGLLENDNHWVVTMDEAVLCQAPTRVRQLFAILISTCTISNPQQLWITYRDEMASDILHRYQLLDSSIRYNYLIYNETLCNIEDRVVSICGKKLQELGLGAPRRNVVTNSGILRELAYDTAELEDNVASMLPKLLPEQRRVFDAVLAKINLSQPIIIFLDAPGGTGKTFLLNLLLAMVRKEQNIAIAVASSGIAATLLAGGRTAHSVLKLPLTFAEGQTAVCNIRKNSDKASLLRSCKLLVWDECTMAHKIALVALDRTLQDIRDDPQPMGGLVVLLAGDFRQTPVVTRGTPADELNACLKSSYLWSHIVKMHLTVNMRVQLHNDTTAAQFADELLKIGEGQLETDSEGNIQFSNTFCQVVESSESLYEKVFPNIGVNYLSEEWLCARTILAPKNSTVLEINNTILNSIPGESKIYRSIDTMVDPDESVSYPPEFLNSLELSGTPSHRIVLKVGVPVILIRNLDPPRLCNGTRLCITQMGTNVLQARILTGYFRGEEVLIPRIPIIPNDLPFKFRRLQFPVMVAFAMTINKSQGQTLQVVAIAAALKAATLGAVGAAGVYGAKKLLGKAAFAFVPLAALSLSASVVDIIERQLKLNERKEEYKMAMKFYKGLLNTFKINNDEQEIYRREEEFSVDGKDLDLQKRKKKKNLKKTTKKILEEIYYNPETGYRGINDLVRKTGYSQKEVSEFLHKQDVYTIHKPIKKKFETRRVYAPYKDYQWVSDLAFMQKDKSFKYILTIIDAFTKYAWAIPIRNKTGDKITNAFREIFKERKAERMQTDKGTEFINSVTQNLLKKHNIEWFATQTITKASIVERFNRTLKELMNKYSTQNNNRKWVDISPSLVKKYNNSFHTSIKMTPVEARDKVRISKYKGHFDKGYLPNFTKEVFKISKVLSTEPVTNKIKDQNNEDVEGGFYNEELVKYDKEDYFYKVEKIIRSRTRNGKKEYFFKWLGYPDSFNSWTSEIKYL
ncbi:hypothetical protein LAZ67_21002525 [Cordylochernes scorpioides]|uniref:ATP-dependent DNA helicase n=1 Tax=Cordylochernes scorpioides TaxID=51811 RepID=A0ABY6LN56_9ARAC|nr:hypothetical protein LAZ67_21002525 [Cordylochernes scorpioides]